MSVRSTALGVTGSESRTVTYGHWVKRAISMAMDELLVIPFIVVAYFLASQNGTGWTVGAMVSVAYGMALGFYNRCIRMGLTGQSWGKQATGTRLISERTGEPLGVGVAIIREMCHTVDGILFLGYMLPLIDRKRQTIGDKMMRAVVVEVERGAPPVGSPLPR